MSVCCENDIVPHTIPFIKQHIVSPDWKARDAAVMALGGAAWICVCEGGGHGSKWAARVCMYVCVCGGGGLWVMALGGMCGGFVDHGFRWDVWGFVDHGSRWDVWGFVGHGFRWDVWGFVDHGFRWDVWGLGGMCGVL